MTVHTHSVGEWLAFLSLGASAVALIALALVFADSDPSDFDPRPWLRLAFDRLCVEAVRAKSDLKTFPRDAATSMAALLLLLSAPVSAPKGATR